MSPLEQQIQALRNEQLLSQSSGQSRDAIEDCKQIYLRFQDVAIRLKSRKKSADVLSALPPDAPETMQFSAETHQKCNKAIINLTRN